MNDQTASRLPNFLYIGPDKAGSSWLHEVLIRHSQVFMSEAKDLYFFDRYYNRGLVWYARQFRDAGPDHAVIGEVTQDYLFCEEAAKRIRGDLGPHVRMMVTLRDPVTRAFSSYRYMLKQGERPGTFREALTGRPELIEHGRYAAGLRRFYEHFPKQQVLVTTFDDLQTDPQRFMDDVFAFLGVHPMDLDESLLAPRLKAAEARSVFLARMARAASNRLRLLDRAELIGRVKRSSAVQTLLYKQLRDEGPALKDRDAALVRELLADDVADLEQLVGRDLRRLWAWPASVTTSPSETP